MLFRSLDAVLDPEKAVNAIAPPPVLASREAVNSTLPFSIDPAPPPLAKPELLHPRRPAAAARVSMRVSKRLHDAGDSRLAGCAKLAAETAV